jgi:hypothetical protein
MFWCQNTFDSFYRNRTLWTRECRSITIVRGGNAWAARWTVEQRARGGNSATGLVAAVEWARGVAGEIGARCCRRNRAWCCRRTSARCGDRFGGMRPRRRGRLRGNENCYGKQRRSRRRCRRCGLRWGGRGAVARGSVTRTSRTARNAGVYGPRPRPRRQRAARGGPPSRRIHVFLLSPILHVFVFYCFTRSYYYYCFTRSYYYYYFTRSYHYDNFLLFRAGSTRGGGRES